MSTVKSANECLKAMDGISSGVERARPAPEDGEFSEEVEDMLERTRNNPNAIIYGTLYSYPVM
jgi:hypothetical protein